jgi:CRISPR-associated endonuclease/helicase Cas3
MNSILAKSSGETLAQHVARCLKVAGIVLDNLPLAGRIRDNLKQDLFFSLALHDVGKAATGFQQALQDREKRWGRRHEVVSAAFATAAGASDEVVFSVITHHRAIPAFGSMSDVGCLPEEEIPQDEELTPVWKKMADEWMQNGLAFTEEWKKICVMIGREDLTQLRDLRPLSIDPLWLRRNKQAGGITFERRRYASLLRGLLISCDHIASSDADIEKMPRRIPLLAEYPLASQSLRAFQDRAGKIKGNVILRAPTGSGKTLAAMLWAQSNQKNNGRLFYVLPNIASINAMYKRVQDYFGEQYVGLLHSRAGSSLYSILSSNDDKSSRLSNQRIARTMSSLSREMWFPFRVCTPHQVLRYSLRGKGWEAMLSEFPNSCFIFDEVHAYDPVITGLTVATAKFLNSLDASCMFLSATMPSFLRKILEKETPSASFLEPSSDFQTDKEVMGLKRHYVKVSDGDIVSRIDHVIDECEKARSSLIVCNHVQTSQRVFELIRAKIPGTVLLHSRFCKRDRNRIENALAKELPKVLVATQVVEVSLDISFDQGFSEPAPLDALVQRFGRINRYGISPPAPVEVFSSQVHGYDIYDPDLVTRSMTELSTLANPLGESDLVQAADKVYASGYSPQDEFRFSEALNHPLIRKFNENLVAGIHKDWVEEVIESVDGSVELLPSSLAAEYDKLDDEGLWVEANDLLVPVRAQKLHSLGKSIDKSHDPWIIRRPYSETMGLDLDLGSE